MKSFRSVFANELSAYVKLRKQLGCKFRSQTIILRAFDQFLVERNHAGPLTEELALMFSCRNEAAGRNWYAQQYHIIRHFADYLSVHDKRAPILQSKAIRKSKERHLAYIYSDEDIGKLLDAALQISRTHPMQGKTLHTIVGMTASTGMRIGEVSRLDKQDFDPQHRTLLIRDTKFSKDRMIPLHPSTCEALLQYGAERDRTRYFYTSDSFFVGQAGQRLSEDAVGRAFRQIVDRVGLKDLNGKRPTFHALRHTFAVKRLTLWYKERQNVQEMLPFLATYMGHLRYTDTAWYLQVTPELLELSAQRYFSSLTPQEEKS